MREISTDKSIWINFLHQRRGRFPLPHHLRNSNASVEEFTSKELENTLHSIVHVSSMWQRHRRSTPVKLGRLLGKNLIETKLFHDRWLLTVYASGHVYLWDTESHLLPVASLKLSFANQESSVIASCIAVLSDDGNSIVVALAQHPPDSREAVTELYDISLAQPKFHLKKNFQSRSRSQTIRDVDVTGCRLAFSFINDVEVLQWGHHRENVNNRCRVALEGMDNPVEGKTRKLRVQETDELDEIFSSLIAARFVGPFLLVFKTQSIELHHIPLPESEFSSIPPIRHQLAYKHFRSVHISVFHQLSSENVVKLTVLGSMSTLELLHLTVSVYIEPPSLDVTIHSGDFDPIRGIGNPFMMPTSLGEPGQNAASGGRNRFITTRTLGAQGTRGVWVERTRTDMTRQIFTFELSHDGSGEGGDGNLEGKKVYSSTSYDLREEWKHCALGETNGRIVLGTRSGDIYVLNIDS